MERVIDAPVATVRAALADYEEVRPRNSGGGSAARRALPRRFGRGVPVALDVAIIWALAVYREDAA